MDLLLRKVDSLLRLLALQVASGRRTAEAIRLLHRAGLDHRLIAEVCNTTPDVVRVRVSEATQKGRTRRKPRRKPARPEGR